MSDKRDIILNLNIWDILPENPVCPDCQSEDVFIDKSDNHLFCNNCNELKDFFETVFKNCLTSNTKKEQDKLIKKLTKITKRKKEEEEYLKQQAELKPIEVKSNSDLLEKLTSLQSKSAMILEAPTGCGKTHSLVQYTFDEYQKGNKIAIICSTIKEVNRVVRMLINAGVKLEDISPVLRGYKASIDDDTISQTYKKIVVTTYGYFFEKGHTATIYKTAEKITKDRIVLADEIHSFETYSRKIINLASKYFSVDTNLKSAEKCPIEMKKGNCENCFILSEHYIEDNELKFYSELPLAMYQGKLNIDIETNLIYQPSFYFDAKLNNVLTHTIQNINEIKPYLKGFDDLLENIISLKDMEVRIQMPFFIEDGEKIYLSYKQLIEKRQNKKPKEKITNPKYACYVPTLIGYSVALFDILFSHAEKIVFATATMPESLRRKIIEKASVYDFYVESVKVERTPFKFNVKVFKLKSGIKRNAIIEILKEIPLVKNKVFLVDATQTRAIVTNTEIRKTVELAEKVTLFRQRDYHKIYDNIDGETESSNSQDDILLTYAGSAVCKAIDMPDRNVVILDCSLFPPTVALNFKGEPTEDEKRMLFADDINSKITQVIGRVFRSKKAYNNDETVIDDKNILIILYNLPPELHCFKPDPKLLNAFEEYTDNHIVGICNTPRTRTAAMIQSINQALNCEPITNKEVEQKRPIIEKAKRDGLSSLERRTERELLNDDDVKEIENYRKNLGM